MSSARSPRKAGKSSGGGDAGDSTPSSMSPTAASGGRAFSSRRGGGDSDAEEDESEGYYDAPMGHQSRRTATASDPATEEFPDHLEALTESAAAKRTKALQAILKMLRSGSDHSEYLISYRDRLTENLVWVLKRQISETEGVLAAQIIALFALVLGADDDDYVNAVSDALKAAITRSSFDSVRVWSMVAFSLVCFICSSLSNVSAWEFCADVFCVESEALPPSARLRATAVDAWVLLGDTVSGAAVLSQSRERVFSALIDLLEETVTEVKVSAGECLGFLWETALDSELEEGREAAAAGAASESAEELANRLLCEDPEEVSRALEVLNSTAKESSKKVSKKDRKEQRGAFREFCDFILDGSFPVDQVRMSGAVIEVETFARRRVLETLKLALGDGFQTSLRAYPVLRGVLGVEFFSTDFMDGDGEDVRVDKNSARDKQRTAFRQQERRLREILKEY